ncbi:MAG: 2-hydroxyacyl-CoA dehydratase [Desulfobacterales bacterium]|nr:2-hydroxyacyl-CoA dehydratase [Desulfobacterales bacterium]
MIEQFQQWYEKRHDYQKAYKARTGRKMVGYLCTYEPEELFYAADILPVRILGSHEMQDVTEPHIFTMFCPYCRDVLAQGLKGKYDYLDGITYGQSCLHLRQAFMSWQMRKNPGWSHYLPTPHHVQSPQALPFMVAEYKILKKKLEAWIGRDITGDDLRRGIDIVNRARRVLKQIFELRKMDPPPITGAESMILAVSAMFVDKVEFAQAAEGLLQGLKTRKLDREPGKRIMLVGSENDDIEYVRMIETPGEGVSTACTVVIEEHCTTTRHFWDEVDTGMADPLTAIADRYVCRTPCPSKDYPRRSRFQRVLKFAQDWKVDGVITLQQKFCDPHEFDIPRLRKFLEDHGLPTYYIELDVTMAAGPFAIRTEAFLETLESDDGLF